MGRRILLLVLFVASVVILETLQKVQTGDDGGARQLSRKVDIGASSSANKEDKISASDVVVATNSDFKDDGNENVVNQSYGRYARGGGGSSSTDARHRIFPDNGRVVAEPPN